MRFVARWTCTFVVTATVAFGVGCYKAAQPAPHAESGQPMLKLRPGAPPLEQTSASFYAKNGEAREVALYFADSTGGRGSLYFRLRLGANAVVAGPDGKPIAAGDSLLITVNIPDPSVLLIQLEPSGLRFAQPAELLLSYAEANQDFDGDGKLEKDEDDQAIERRLGIWRQEVPGGPFERLKSQVDGQLDQVTAPLDGFTRYAISY